VRKRFAAALVVAGWSAVAAGVWVGLGLPWGLAAAGAGLMVCGLVFDDGEGNS
jgi:hypothetical protein